MQSVKRVTLAATVLLAVVAILGFVLENQQAVSISFLGWDSGQMPVAFFVVVALIIGMIVGPILNGAFVFIRSKKSVRKLHH